MTDRIELINPADLALKKQLDAVTWPIEYGKIVLQIRNNGVTLVTVERTIKLD